MSIPGLAVAAEARPFNIGWDALEANVPPGSFRDTPESTPPQAWVGHLDTPDRTGTVDCMDHLREILGHTAGSSALLPGLWNEMLPTSLASWTPLRSLLCNLDKAPSFARV